MPRKLVELGLRNEVSVLRSENVLPEVGPRTLVVVRLPAVGVPRETSEDGERLMALARDAVVRGADVVALELANRDELGCAREIVGTPLEVVREGAGR